MENQNRFNTKKLITRAAMGAMIWMICLALGGCGKEMARIEQNQFELQQLIQFDTQLTAENMKQIEEKQGQLHVSIEDVQDSSQKHADDVKAAITQEHAALQDMMQIHNQRLTNSLAGFERSQSSLTGGIEGLNANITRIDGNTSNLERELMKMQQSNQNNNKEMTNLINVIGQRQIRSEERIAENIQAVVGAIKDLHQNHAGMQEQIIAMQNKDQDNSSKIIAALEQMKVTLSQMQTQISSLSPAKNMPNNQEEKK
jgi:hypothetical protein